MEKKRKSEVKKMSWNKKALIFICIAALGLTSCFPNKSVASSPVVPTPVIETSYLQSIDTTIWNIDVNLETVETTPLAMKSSGGNVISIQLPPLPCGKDDTLAVPNEVVPTTVAVDVRNQLCNVSEIIINKIFNKNFTQDQIEKFTSNIIIVSQSDLIKLCNEKIVSGCYKEIPDVIILSPHSISPGTIIHEKTHAKKLKDSKFFDEDTGVCFKYNPDGGFLMFYDDNTSTTEWSMIFMLKELIPSIFEKQLIENQKEIGGITVFQPGYLVTSNADEKDKEELRTRFDNLDFSQVDPIIVLDDKSITMQELFEYVETITDNKTEDLVLLSDLFSKVIKDSGMEQFQTYTPIQTSSSSPAKACR